MNTIRPCSVSRNFLLWGVQNIYVNNGQLTWVVHVNHLPKVIAQGQDHKKERGINCDSFLYGE